MSIVLNAARAWRNPATAPARGTVHAMDIDDTPVPAMDKKDFFLWCDQRELRSNPEIAAAFRVSSQTIRNWQRKEEADQMPAWIPLACLAIETVAAGEPVPVAETMTVARLSEWQGRHRFKTYEDTACVFQIKRQAVHNWYKRQRFPKWLPLACLGYDVAKSRIAKDSARAA